MDRDIASLVAFLETVHPYDSLPRDEMARVAASFSRKHHDDGSNGCFAESHFGHLVRWEVVPLHPNAASIGRFHTTLERYLEHFCAYVIVLTFAGCAAGHDSSGSWAPRPL